MELKLHLYSITWIFVLRPSVLIWAPMLKPWIFENTRGSLISALRCYSPGSSISDLRSPMLKPISDAKALDLRNQISVDHFDRFDAKALRRRKLVPGRRK